MKRERHIIFMLVVMSLFLSMGLFADEKADKKKARELYKAGKLEESLAVTDAAIKKYPQNKIDWLERKYYTLLKLKRYESALETALLRYKLAEPKTPGKSLHVASVYLKLNNKEGALKWIETAANLGYRKYRTFETNPDYTALKGDKRMVPLIEKIKDNIGFGKAPTDFTLETLAGKPFTLSKQKGKVVLVDFWATWCSPCVVEVPNLKKCYAQFKDKGFEIIGISLDLKKKALTDFLKKEGITWPMTFSAKGWDDETRALYKINSIPSMWLVDKKGVLRYFDVRGEDLEKAIAKLVVE